VLRLPPQSKPHATVMQPLQCVLQHHVSNPHVSTHMATKRDNNHAAMTLRSASTDSKTAYNYGHITTTRCRTPRENRFAPGTVAAATAAHTRYPSSPPAATLYGKTQGFVLRLPPQSKPHATVMQPLQCVLQHHVSNPHVSTHNKT